MAGRVRLSTSVLTPPGEGDIRRARAAIGLDHDLSGSEKAIAFWLLRHLNHETGECFPSIGRLCDVSGLSRATVGRAVQVLHRRGLIRTVRHAGRHGCNLYCPDWTMLRQLEAALNDDFNRNAWKHRPGARADQSKRGSVLEENSKRLATRGRVPHFVRSRASSEVASTNAERRWMQALQETFGGNTDRYAAVLDLITPALQDEATAAEMRRHGAGLQLVLDRARTAGLISTTVPARANPDQTDNPLTLVVGEQP